MMTAASVRDLLEPILRAQLGPYGYTHAEVRLETEFYDEPVWDIDVFFGEDALQPDPDATIGATIASSQALARLGEERFPALHLKFAGEPKAA